MTGKWGNYMGIVRQVVLIFCFAVCTALAVNALSPRGIALVGEWNPDKGTVTARSKNDVVNHGIEIDTDTARRLFLDKAAVFVDARPRDSYDEGHIEGAYCLPLHEFDSYFEDFITRYPPSEKFILYCSGVECDESHQLAKYLKDFGYEDLHVFAEGYPAWKKGGNPIEGFHEKDSDKPLD